MSDDYGDDDDNNDREEHGNINEMNARKLLNTFIGFKSVLCFIKHLSKANQPEVQVINNFDRIVKIVWIFWCCWLAAAVLYACCGFCCWFSRARK